MAGYSFRISFHENHLHLDSESYAQFIADLKALHSFPPGTWQSVPSAISEMDNKIGMPMRALPDDISKLSDSRVDGLARTLSDHFAKGTFLWPFGEAAKTVRELKERHPANAAELLVSELQKQASSPSQQQPEANIESLASTISVAVAERVRREMTEAQKRADQRLEAERADFNKQRLANEQWFTDRSNQIDGSIAKHVELAAGLSTKLDEWTSAKNAELESAKDAFETSFATQEAHTYWATTKYHRHTRLAQKLLIGGALYVFLVFVAAALFVWKGRVFLNGHVFEKTIWETPLAVALPLAIVAIVVIWLGRLLARSYMAHVQLAEDAQERATTIETYIALIRAGVLDKANAEEAHKALFRPTSSGLLAGDSGPDTPIEIVTKALSGSKT